MQREQREKGREKEGKERERHFSLSSSSSYIGTNLLIRTPNLDDIKMQKCIVSVLVLTSPKSRYQQEHILSKTCRVWYIVWTAKQEATDWVN